jgi:hypothetical protein
LKSLFEDKVFLQKNFILEIYLRLVRAVLKRIGLVKKRVRATKIPPVACHPSKKISVVGAQNKILDEQILKASELPISPPLFLVSILNGAISVDENACHQVGIEPEKAKATIKELNLNCKRLCQVRKRILKKLDADYQKQRASLGNPTFTQIDALLNQMTAQSLAINPDGSLPAFFTTIRAFFGSRAETFLA